MKPVRSGAERIYLDIYKDFCSQVILIMIVFINMRRSPSIKESVQVNYSSQETPSIFNWISFDF